MSFFNTISSTTVELAATDLRLSENQGIYGQALTATAVNLLARSRGFGFNPAVYDAIQIGEANKGIGLFIDPNSITGGSFNGNINEVLVPNRVVVLQANAGGTDWINVLLDLNNGSLILNADLAVAAGTALAPTIHYSSETSLGWYRSAASTMALSYGTLWPQGALWVTSGISALSSIVTSSYVSSTRTLMGGDVWGSSLSINVGLNVKAGVNKSCGTAVLGSNGSVNVANTYVAAGDLIFLTDQAPGGTLGDLELGGIRAGSGFTIQSTSVTDTSTIAWLIVRPT